MGLLKWLTGTTAGLMLISCVTINIYFPAAAAEKAADRIIEDVWGRENPTQPQPTESEDSTSAFIALLSTQGGRSGADRPNLKDFVLGYIDADFYN